MDKDMVKGFSKNFRFISTRGLGKKELNKAMDPSSFSKIIILIKETL